MGFSHERLDVYNQAIEFTAWSQSLLDKLPTHASTRSQLDSASTSIPLNIAEGNAKSSRRDRASFWRIALGSTLECAAILDVLVARKTKTSDEVSAGKETLERIAAMLIRLLNGLESRA